MNSAKARGLVVLLGCRDERGIYRFPVDQGLKKGLHVSPMGADPTQALQKVVAERIGHPELAASIRVEDVFEAAVSVGHTTGLPLCVAVVGDESFKAPTDWPTLPDILRAMPPNRERLVFMKAVQLLAGSHEDSLTAVELTEEVRKALRRSLDPDFQG